MLLLATLVISPLVSQAQRIAGDSQPDWWFNVPSSPLIIQAQAIGSGSHDEKHPYRYGLKNLSSKTIRGYRLGCVEKQRGKVRLFLDHRPFYPEGGFSPGQFTKDVQEIASPSVEEIKADSACQGGRIAVVEVYFTDGTNWYAHNLPWEEARVND
jgi:hypothetical protein